MSDYHAFPNSPPSSDSSLSSSPSPNLSAYSNSLPSSSSSSLSIPPTSNPKADLTALKRTRIFSHSAACLSPGFLNHVAGALRKGEGDLACLVAPSCDSTPGSQSIEDAMSILGLGNKASMLDQRWRKVSCSVNGKEIMYYADADETPDVSQPSSASSEFARYGIRELMTEPASSPNNTESFCEPTQSHADALNGFAHAGLRCVLAARLSQTATLQHQTLYIVERPAISFPPLVASPPVPLSQAASSDTPFGIPTLDEWCALWAAWDLVTLQMIPSEMLHQKPIDLRHKCLFYIGHIPTFLDMLMSKALLEPDTNSGPKKFTDIFERGIDPHVDDPDHCHSHSEVPDADEDWPTLDSILTFRNNVRARLIRLYADLHSGKRQISRQLARMLVMTLEHEGFHVETLLYMLIQSASTVPGSLPPPGFTTPLWTALASQWKQLTPQLTSCTTTLGPATVVLGHDDSEADDFRPELMYDDVNGHAFGWDNESPRRAVQVGKFSVEWRPISNGEFYEFWKGGGAKAGDMPKSWVCVDGDIMARTLYGPVSFEVAREWPVLAAYDDLVKYAAHKGGRLPTEPELRHFLDVYEVGHEGGANVGFRNWHPTPATTGGSANSGRGSNGGVWEWTTTAFDGHDGLVPTDHFTGYSTDFFDGKHQIVLGASYVTIPRLASRRTLRNFYQHNYPYPWVGARVVYDL